MRIALKKSAWYVNTVYYTVCMLRCAVMPLSFLLGGCVTPMVAPSAIDGPPPLECSPVPGMASQY